MKKQIWKYVLKRGSLNHEIPFGATFLHVGDQFGDICLWFEVDPLAEKKMRQFEVFGTGDELEYDIGAERKHLGTIKSCGGRLIWHIYERKAIA